MKEIIFKKEENRVPIKSWVSNMDSNALEQANNLSNLPFVFKHVALMPDCHMGYGMPIGGVIATENVIIPNAVGVDIGCGMCAVKSNIKTDDTDNTEIVFKYCTNARIEKCIFKLIDEGNKLEREMMNKLPTMVYNDIMEEEWKEITNSRNRYKIDFYNLNKLITKRCLAVLDQIIVNNALN